MTLQVPNPILAVYGRIYTLDPSQPLRHKKKASSAEEKEDWIAVIQNAAESLLTLHNFSQKTLSPAMGEKMVLSQEELPSGEGTESPLAQVTRSYSSRDHSSANSKCD